MRSNAIQEWATKTATLCAKRQALENISGTTDAPIYKYLKLVLEAMFFKCIHDFFKHLNAAAGSINLATTMVGADNALDTILYCLDSIFSTLNSFKNDRHLGD